MKKIIIFCTQNDLQGLSDELNNINWSAFPIGEKYGVIIPIAIIITVFFGFRYMAKLIEKD